MMEKDRHFYSELDQLNKDFLEFIKATLEKSPYFDLTPTLKDYIRQFEELEKGRQEKSNGFSWIQPVDNNVANNTVANNVANNEEETANNEEDAPPPEPVVETYDEPNTKYQTRCKLYERGKSADGTASINLMGCGILYVKTMDQENKLQIVFRQDPSLRKVLLNEVITPQIPIKLVQKCVQILLPGPSGESKFHFAKMKDEKESNELFKTLTSIK